MRRITTFVALVLAGAAVAGAAAAAPTVDVSIGAGLQKKAKTYGEREFNYLSNDLQRSIENAAARSGDPALDGARFNLVIADAQPNRPTFKQLGDTIGLSPRSFGVGGATLEGSVTYPDGRVVPVSYRWYNHDITDARGSTTWTAASRAFDMFAYKVARDGAVATR